MMAETAVTDEDQSADLRNAMTSTLIADGYIDSPDVESAFRKVPREAFAPGDFPLNTVYDTREVLRGRRDATGTVLSSVSAPWMQARMIAQAGIQPGMSVLEIGSGGYNAALLAEITGTAGRVVSVDIFSVKSSVLNFWLSFPRGLAGRFSRTEPDGATRCGGLLDHDGHGRSSTQHAVGVS